MKPARCEISKIIFLLDEFMTRLCTVSAGSSYTASGCCAFAQSEPDSETTMIREVRFAFCASPSRAAARKCRDILVLVE